MVHLRIVVPADRTDPVLEVLEGCPTVVNVVLMRDVARKPEGDLVLCDVAKEDASVVVADLKALHIDRDGSIAIETIETALSAAADRAERQAEGSPSDAVLWEQVTERTSEESALSGTFLVFIVLAAIIASVGIYLNSPILIVGAMVVGPEFGPVAGFCVAIVKGPRKLAARSLAAYIRAAQRISPLGL